MDFSKILIVSDYDGTLTGPDHIIPETNRRAIRAFMEQGGAFAIGSGRGVSMQREILEDFPVNAPCICSNGSVLYDFSKKELISLTAFSAEEMEKVAEVVDHDMTIHDCVIIEAGTDDYYLPSEVDARFDVEKEGAEDPEKRWVLSQIIRENTKIVPVRETDGQWVKLSFYVSEDNMEHLAKACQEKGLNGQKSWGTLYELQPIGINKGVGARKLAKILGREVLVCIGDEENDLAMLEAADLAFVTDSAKPSMRARGYLPCAPCQDGAVADVIRQLKELPS